MEEGKNRSLHRSVIFRTYVKEASCTRRSRMSFEGKCDGKKERGEKKEGEKKRRRFAVLPPGSTEKIDEERVRKQFSSPVVLSLRNGDLYSAS